MDVHDCTDVRNKGFHKSGVYQIYLVDLSKHIHVYCDMETYNGEWLVRIHIYYLYGEDGIYTLIAMVCERKK